MMKKNWKQLKSIAVNGRFTAQFTGQANCRLEYKTMPGTVVLYLFVAGIVRKGRIDER